MYKNILVALDRSPLAEQGLDSAIDTAKQNPGSQLVLLTILDTALLGEGLSYGGVAYNQVQSQINQIQEDEACKYMDSVAAKVKKAGIKAEVVIGRGAAAEGIIDYTEKNQADLIVITTHGRSGLGKFFLGSVAGKVISVSPVPVLVVPPAKK